MKGFIWLTPSICGPSLKEVQAGTHGRNLEGEADAEAMGGAACWLTPHDLLSLLSYTT